MTTSKQISIAVNTVNYIAQAVVVFCLWWFAGGRLPWLIVASIAGSLIGHWLSRRMDRRRAALELERHHDRPVMPWEGR